MENVKMDELKVESDNCTPMPHALEWFIPLMDWLGNGEYWCAGSMTRTKEDAEMQIRDSSQEVKQARIVHVMLPCKVIP